MRIASVILFGMIQKLDLLKDIYVALTLPHANLTHAFLYWFSINFPIFSLLIYFWSTNQRKQFIPSFIGFGEIFNFS